MANFVIERLTEPATCGEKSHEPPGDACHCGYYALFSRQDAIDEYFSQGDGILVRVSAVGETVIHEQGFRASQLRLDAMYVLPSFDEEIAAALDRRYGIPAYQEEICTSESPSNEFTPSPFLSQNAFPSPSLSLSQYLQAYPSPFRYAHLWADSLGISPEDFQAELKRYAADYRQG